MPSHFISKPTLYFIIKKRKRRHIDIWTYGAYFIRTMFLVKFKINYSIILGMASRFCVNIMKFSNWNNNNNNLLFYMR